MIPRVSQEAVNKLGEEMRKIDSHGSYTLNRLKNEDPRYAAIADSFLSVIQAEHGKEACETVRNIIAACYRIIELSEKYPDKAQMLADALLGDPLQSAEEKDIISAEQETTQVLQNFKLHEEK